MQVASFVDKQQMRWDTVMVWWCLYLRHLSSSAYELLQKSGTIMLPSQRTLRDYTYYTKAAVGFANDVDQQLKGAAKLLSCSEKDKCVIIIMD